MIPTFPEIVDNSLLKLANVTFAKFNASLFKKINWEIKKGEIWAITGPTGSGKTTLSEAISGKYPIREGNIYYNLGATTSTISKQIALVSFSPNSTKLNYKNFYYQQRYNSSDSEASITVEDFFAETDISNLESILKLLRIEDLLPLEVIKLSNGQTRKILLARALLQKPHLLILDNPYAGLDVNTRKDLDNILTGLITQGTPIILITNQQNIPAYITHVLHLENFAITGKYTRAEYLHLHPTNIYNPKSEKSDYLIEKLFPKISSLDFDIAVKFENTNVQYDGRKILKNINWTVNKGEKWALVGPNGSGKTTLLSLINGDNPQAFANKITLFDRRKGSGESIWEIKKKIGFVSPELHLYFRQNISGETVVATGFLDTLYINRKITPEENVIINIFFSHLDIEHLRQKSFLQMSSGEQRLLLLIRSLVKNPPLLIWDEPFQGLSSTLLKKATDLLQAYATSDKTIILVSHYNQEIPDWITKTLYLEDGAIKEITEK